MYCCICLAAYLQLLIISFLALTSIYHFYTSFFTAYSLQNAIALISLRRVKRRENEILEIFVYVTVAVDYLYRNTCCPCYESK